MCKLHKHIQKSKLLREEDRRLNDYLDGLDLNKQAEMERKMEWAENLENVDYEFVVDAGKVDFYIKEDPIEDEDLFLITAEIFTEQGIDYVQHIYNKLMEVKPS